MDCISCQDLANDSGQMEEEEEEEDGIAFPELRPASGWTQLKSEVSGCHSYKIMFRGLREHILKVSGQYDHVWPSYSNLKTEVKGCVGFCLRLNRVNRRNWMSECINNV